MFRLRFEARQCLCCGICMDVCLPRAIDMHSYRRRGVEGDVLTYVMLDSQNNVEIPQREKTAFPFMAKAHVCDGCIQCVNECPTSALKLVRI